MKNSSSKSILIGAVAYDAKVVPIWEGIRAYFLEADVDFDFVLFSNYEALVEALLDGFIDIAWNTNLAFVKTENRLGEKCRLLAMRDTDLGFTSRLVVLASSTIESLEDLNGRVIAFGSRDSAQAALMPEYYLRQHGLLAGTDYTAIRFDSDVGKHGDTGRSEEDVLSALRGGSASAGAVGESTWLLLAQKGLASDFRSIWISPPYSHCVFTALPGIDDEKASLFIDTLLAMDYDNPNHRTILELEGLRQWVPGERDGYRDVIAAVEQLGYDKIEAGTGAGASMQ